MESLSPSTAMNDNPINQQSARQAVYDMYPQAHAVQIVEHGYANLVALVDETYVIRFPRNHAAYIRSQYEKEVLAGLRDLQSVQLPHVIDERRSPACLVARFLPGVHLRPEQIRQLPASDQVRIGQEVAAFAFEMHSLLSITECRRARRRLYADLKEKPWDWQQYISESLIGKHFPTVAHDNIAKRYFAEWNGLAVSPPVVVHDDLHYENLLFNEGHLSGVIDFANTEVGSPEQELRQLYHVSTTAVVAAVQEYERLSGTVLNVRAIRVWAIVQELAAYSEHLFGQDTAHPAFTRASANLNRWFNTTSWGCE